MCAGGRTRRHREPARALAAVLGLERSKVHVKVPDVGGGFGAKIALYPEQAPNPVRNPASRYAPDPVEGLGSGKRLPAEHAQATPVEG